jgi:phospholipid/cholesterol/gamma-HCH transport system permease protein
MNRASSILDHLGKSIMKNVEEMGKITMLLLSALAWMVRPPLKARLIFKQMEFVGVKSILVVLLTGTFTGMVMALQGYHGFRLFSAEGLVGSTVALGMTLGTMRVTEQIDALYVMAANPIKHLIVPRIIAGVVMVPILTIVSDFVGIMGGYFVGVGVLNINSGIFVKNIYRYLDLDDIFNGLIKAACFGLILSLIGCYKGFNTRGGAEGVGRATTEAVVLASISILISDYFLTAIMF